MAGNEENNLNFNENGQNADLNDDFVPEDAWPVCPNCFQPCNPLQNYCEKCGSNQVINPLAAYLPFVNLRFNYDGLLTMWRKIWFNGRTSTVLKGFYLFLIIVMAPIIIILGLPFILTEGIKNKFIKAVSIIILIILLYAVIFYLLRTYVPLQKFIKTRSFSM
jgi:hypothetical protein